MQLFYKLSSLVLFLSIIVCNAVPNPEGSKRVIDKVSWLFLKLKFALYKINL